MNFPEYTRKYMLTGITAGPDVLEALLQNLDTGDPVWDFRADPERFTLRFIVAHLADWETIFLGRMTRTRDESDPYLPDLDEGDVAIKNDYAATDPIESLARFRAGRKATVEMLSDLTPADWERVAHRDWGAITLVNQAVLLLGHDGYHNQQIVQWLKAANR